MFQGKTKRGVSVKRTLGMKTPAQKSSWILVADRSHLRLFAWVKKDIGSALELKEEFAYPKDEQTTENLVKNALGMCQKNQIKQSTSQLFIIADPVLKGKLRKALEQDLPKLETKYFEKDYAWVDNNELGHRLSHLLF